MRWLLGVTIALVSGLGGGTQSTGLEGSSPGSDQGERLGAEHRSFAPAIRRSGVAGDDSSLGQIRPDLTMSSPRNLSVQAEPDGTHELRFDAIMNNLGSGDFEVHASRGDDGWDLQQQVTLEEGGELPVAFPADLIWGGDGHDHWHIIDAARYWLATPDGPLAGDQRLDHKVGFCMFDSVPQDLSLPGAPRRISHPGSGCGVLESQALAMGISIGWGDLYTANLQGQYIDITGLQPGIYRLLAEVDPDKMFREEDRSNNFAWIDFELVAPTAPGDPPGLIELESGNSYVKD